ncbi:response regulator, partial [Aurantimonas sp. A2-1-M11]|uniref:response regulator n=1 Tax=Aurantimonas sp. A2-1-M11 TaxID=3113712 RepID=UPI002F939B1F
HGILPTAKIRRPSEESIATANASEQSDYKNFQMRFPWDILRDMLSKKGHELIFADNGAEALNLVQKEPFDLVLMDVQMPVMDGVEATRRIRELSGPAGQVPIVALTANVMASERNKYLSAGMNDYQMKPIDWEQLQAAISRYGGNGQAAGIESAGERVVREEDEALPLVDRDVVERVRRQTSSDQAAVFLRRSIEDAERYCEQIRGLEVGSEELIRGAHSLRGTSGTLGLARISHLSGEIETKARQGHSAEHLAAELRQAVTATRAELQARGLVQD